MFKKINNVFRPNHHGHRGRDAGAKQDYHSACTVRLVRSTSMLVVGEKRYTADGSTLKRSKSTSQNCLEYLEALVALRRQYTKSVSDLKSQEAKSTVSTKKKRAPAPPQKDPPEPAAKPSTPLVPNEEDTLEFFDAVIASCDKEPLRKPYKDDGHADVDFIVASSSTEHDLHSNWVLKVPRDADGSTQTVVKDSAIEKAQKKKKNQSGSTSSRLRLQRNPIHLPKVVESAFQTLRFKPKLKKQ
ncbi:uncharacterized protein C13orf42 isoform X2 [Oryzias melastigma]|uniref:uncharacterized protein C13orf42 isoform X2 n=1 Tax=Oryzias melastigma TaxID=30732 RepID=UPI000CF7EC5D|nr:uncharacterized protein C13orf42 isoform X2 [Oryzias melastigma]